MPQSISIARVDGKPGKVYYPLSLDELPKPLPKAGEVVVRIHAAALNHRDLFIRQHLYPGTSFGIPLLSDACGTVTELGPGVDSTWKGKRVVINPTQGWQDSREGPEDQKSVRILGGTKYLPKGVLQEYFAVSFTQLEEAPDHLDDVHAAALPLTGVTAWRAVMVKCGPQNIGPGKNILITGIGGGVALMALQFAVASGANVYVTSGSREKILQAKSLGARDGVNYKDKEWDKALLSTLPSNRNYFDAIVDGAGNDVVNRAVNLLKHGGPIAVYGMTTGPKISLPMSAVLKNIEVKGSTMGSRQEFTDMMKFVKRSKINSVVSRVVRGFDLNAIDGLFDDMKKGTQFGKLVIAVPHGRQSRI